MTRSKRVYAFLRSESVFVKLTLIYTPIGFVVLGESDTVSSNSEGTNKGSIAEKRAQALGAWADALTHINNNMLQSLS